MCYINASSDVEQRADESEKERDRGPDGRRKKKAGLAVFFFLMFSFLLSLRHRR